MAKSIKIGWRGMAVQAVYALALCVSVAGLSVAASAQTAQYGVMASAVVGISSGAIENETSPDDSILTIRKRVDEVNVFFIATIVTADLSAI